jgi:hypothetical protein
MMSSPIVCAIARRPELNNQNRTINVANRGQGDLYL